MCPVAILQIPSGYFYGKKKCCCSPITHPILNTNALPLIATKLIVSNWLCCCCSQRQSGILMKCCCLPSKKQHIVMNNYRSSRFFSLYVPLFFFLAALGFFLSLSEGKKMEKMLHKSIYYFSFRVWKRELH